MIEFRPILKALNSNKGDTDYITIRDVCPNIFPEIGLNDPLLYADYNNKIRIYSDFKFSAFKLYTTLSIYHNIGEKEGLEYMDRSFTIYYDDVTIDFTNENGLNEIIDYLKETQGFLEKIEHIIHNKDLIELVKKHRVTPVSERDKIFNEFYKLVQINFMTC